MSNIIFWIKKVIKNKMNIIPVLLILIFILFMYYCAHDSAYKDIYDSRFSGEAEVEVLKSDIANFEKELEYYEPQSIDYAISNENLSMAKKRLLYISGKLDAIKNKDWKKYYTNDKELLKITINILEEDPLFTEHEIVESLKLGVNYDQYMADHNLAFDDRFSNVQGFSYFSKVMNLYSPILITVFLIFIISKLYCSMYYEKMNIQNVLPYSSVTKQFMQLLSGTIIGISIVLFISIESILCGTLGSTLGSLSTPIISYTSAGVGTYISLLDILPQLSILVFLGIIFLTNFVSVISTIIRKNLTCLLISLAIILGCLLVIQELAPLQNYIHLLPTTYLQAFKVLSGELAYQCYNANINFTNGIMILLVFNILLFVVNYYLPKVNVRKVCLK